MTTKQPAAEPAGPCVGLKVLDLSTMVSGPMGGQMFGDLGADVVKLEAIGGDTMRAVIPHHKGLSAFFTHYNRSKRSIAVDLKSDQGREIAVQLALKADVLIENFRPGVTERLGLGYETLREKNPGLVYLSIKGFGEDGPYKDQPAYDQVIQGLVGFMPLQGGGSETPVPIKMAVVDKVSAMSGVMSVLAALWARERNGGKGQKVFVKMLDAWAAFVSQEEIKNHTFVDSEVPPPPLRDVYRVFKTRDGHVIGLTIQDNQFRGLCAALNRPELLTDPRFAKPGDRLENVSQLNDEVSPSIAALTTAEVLERTRKHEVPMGPVNTLELFFDDPQAKHNKTFPEISDPEFGTMRGLNFFASFGGTPLSLTRRAPMLGEQTDAILREAGRSDQEIKSLRETKVVR